MPINRPYQSPLPLLTCLCRWMMTDELLVYTHMLILICTYWDEHCFHEKRVPKAVRQHYNTLTERSIAATIISM